MIEIKKFFGEYGGMYIPETLVPIIQQIADETKKALDDIKYKEELKYYFKNYIGRPSPLYYAERLSKELGGAKILLKREDLNHTGSHKINNTIGQVLLAKRMGKKRIIAETGAGQHGVATATACSLFGLDCVVYMGAKDIERQKLNVFRMKLLGAKVITVETGTQTLKDAINEALKDWVTNVDNTFYCFGTAAGTYPFPFLVRELQKIIGQEVKEQVINEYDKLPDVLIAAVGGGSNSIGLFYPFIEDKSVSMFGVEAGGDGIKTGNHASTLCEGKKGIFHGSKSYLLQDDNGQIKETYSISAGLDYPGIGPEHSFLKDSGRVNYVSIKDKEVLEAFQILSKTEGIIPALESSHAIAYSLKIASNYKKDQIIVVNVSGRGDKDVETVASILEDKNYAK